MHTIDARKEPQANGFRAFSNSGALANFLSSIAVGESKTIHKFITAKGEEMRLARVQMMLPAVKPDGSSFKTMMVDGGVVIRRVK